MKDQIRLLGIDDAAFDFNDKKVKVVGVVMRAPAYIEGVMVTEVEVDGLDSTEKLIEMVNTSRYKRQLKLIAIDGIALGGFNVVDIRGLYEATDVPVVTITREEPNFDDIRDALKKHFTDWEKRLQLMKNENLEIINTEHKPIYIDRVGIELAELTEILNNATIRGALPEAVRVAHLIATAMAKGESHGRA